MKTFYLAACATIALIASGSAQAAPVVTTVNADLLSAPVTAMFQGATFTFSGTNDIFAPLTVQSNNTGAFSAFGGFLGIPLVPTTSFTDRGTVTYGPEFGQFASFTTPTNINATNGDNFIGLRASIGDDFFYGYAFTTGNLLNSYAFETTANTAITASSAVAAVPEASTWAMMMVGFGLVAGAARYSRRSTKAAIA
jgi:hypothetical protein